MQTCLLLLLLNALPAEALILSTDHIVEVLQSEKTSIVLLDVRETEAYLEGHLPGAATLPLKSLSEKRDGVANLLKPDDVLKTALLHAGVDPRKRIVIYGSGKDMDDMKAVGRMFWMLEYLGYPRVTVMNGGLAQWTREKRAVATGVAMVVPLKESAWTITPQPERRASKVTVAQWRTQQEGLLIDSRSADYFQGRKLKEGVVAKKGHIPGATSCPAGATLKTVLDAKGQPVQLLLPERAAILEGLGATAQADRVITYCNGGNAASIGYLLYRVAGVDNIAMYDGSMAEWTLDEALPVLNPTAEADPEGSGTK